MTSSSAPHRAGRRRQARRLRRPEGLPAAAPRGPPGAALPGRPAMRELGLFSVVRGKARPSGSDRRARDRPVVVAGMQHDADGRASVASCTQLARGLACARSANASRRRSRTRRSGSGLRPRPGLPPQPSGRVQAAAALARGTAGRPHAPPVGPTRAGERSGSPSAVERTHRRVPHGPRRLPLGERQGRPSAAASRGRPLRRSHRDVRHCAQRVTTGSDRRRRRSRRLDRRPGAWRSGSRRLRPRPRSVRR